MAPRRSSRGGRAPDRRRPPRTGRTPPARRAARARPRGGTGRSRSAASRWRRPSTEPSLRLIWLTWKPPARGQRSRRPPGPRGSGRSPGPARCRRPGPDGWRRDDRTAAGACRRRPRGRRSGGRGRSPAAAGRRRWPPAPAPPVRPVAPDRPGRARGRARRRLGAARRRWPTVWGRIRTRAPRRRERADDVRLEPVVDDRDPAVPRSTGRPRRAAPRARPELDEVLVLPARQCPGGRDGRVRVDLARRRDDARGSSRVVRRWRASARVSSPAIAGIALVTKQGGELARPSRRPPRWRSRRRGRGATGARTGRHRAGGRGCR